MSFPTAAPPGPDLWEHLAACRDQDPALFFGPNRFEPKRERLAREAAAKEVCGGCRVRRQCLDYARWADEPFGVWGGLSEPERRDLELGAGAA